MQEAILEALNGRAMRPRALGEAVGDYQGLFRNPGGLSELRNRGLVRWHTRWGFYRPEAPPPEIQSETGRSRAPRSDCGQDILGVLRQAGRCLTGPEIQKELASAPRPWSAWTVRRALARMVRQGQLLHQAGGPGLGGYGLPEWEWSESRTQKAANLEEDPRSRCRQNILQVLREVGLPLTRALLLPAMVERGFPWREEIVTQVLEEMTREGSLIYHQGPRRPGYGLPEWEPPFRKRGTGRKGRTDQ